MFLIMLQVTGHAGGVPKAILERGRSVEFPSEGNIRHNSLCITQNNQTGINIMAKVFQLFAFEMCFTLQEM